MPEAREPLSNGVNREFERYEVYLSPEKVLRFIIYIIFVLASINFFAKLLDNWNIHYPYSKILVKEFYVDNEKNIPAFFSVLLLLADSFVLAIISHFKILFRHQYIKHWLGLSAIFFLLAMDEGFSFHELLVFPLHAALHIHGGFLTFTWVVAGGVFVLLFLLSYWRFTFKLPATTRRLFITAFLLYIGAAVGLEMIGGDLADLYGFDSLPYLIETTVEESMEMLGASVFLYALLSYLKTQLSDREIHLCLHRK